MFRLFLPLYLILAAFFIGFIFAVQELPEYFLEDRISDFDDRVTRGTFFLIERRLTQSDRTERKAILEDIQDNFGFPVLFIETNDQLLSHDDWEKIKQGELLRPEFDDAEYYVRGLKDQSGAIAFTFMDMEYETDHREAVGTFYLIKEYLNAYPVLEWQYQLEKLKNHFGFPVSLIPNNELKIDNEKKLNLLKQGKVIALNHDTKNYLFFGEIENSGYTLQAGPIQPPITQLSLLLMILSSLVILLGLALLLWVRPLWLSVRDITQAADQFGHGNLAARSSIKPSSMLGRLASQFNQMAEHIGQLITGHRELTNAVSHELRTPIARMRFAMDMLKNSQSNEDRNRYLSSINTDIDDLESMVDELLTYARFENMGSMEKLTPLELISWTKELMENARGYAGNIELSFKSSSDQFIADCNPRYLARVLHNLLRNAVRYAKQEIVISINPIESPDKAIKTNWVEIHVDDDGPGVAVSERERVFEAFSRTDESRDRESGGHGLGLAIAQRITQAHHGNIEISESPAGGARFTIRWPQRDST